MPDGYLVQVSGTSLDPGDAIVDPLVTFTTDLVIGPGNWEWSGTWNGSSFTNEPEPGEYILATDGNIYFVPDFGPVDTLTSSSVTVAPDIEITGTTGDDTALDGTAYDDNIDGLEGADTITGGAGDDVIQGGGGGDTLRGGSGEDTITGGDGADQIFGGGQGDTLFGGADADQLSGGGGADFLVGGSGGDTLDGGSGNDTLYGDADPADLQNETLRWDLQGTNGSDLTGGFTQTTGAMDVTVTITNDGALTSAEVDTVNDQHFVTGEPFSENSALELAGSGGSDTATVTLTFASTDDGDTEDAVQNVSFRLNDVDTGGWTDTFTITAVDGNGDPVTVTLTATDTTNVTNGGTVTAGVGNGASDTPAGSVLVEIAGPVARIDIDYGNDGSGGQRAWLTDVNFDTIPPPAGDDTLDGGLGADDMFGGAGDDTFFVSDGDEAYGESGDDIFILGDLGEANAAITIDGGEDGETGGDTLRLNGQATLSDVVFDSGNPEAGTITLTDGTVVSFSNVENIICFTPGTLIDTVHGPRAIETLAAGDLVLTRDHGPQPIRWIGARTVPGQGPFAPIEISPAACPGGTAPLLVSPQHRMLFTGYRAELLFGAREVLVAAKHILDGQAVRLSPRSRVTYIHIMFDTHEVITANGMPTESLHAADQSLAALDDAARHELFDIFPELRGQTFGPTARRALKAYEATLL